MEQVQESLHQSAIENMAMLVEANNNHLLAPLTGGVNSHPKFNTHDYTRQLNYYCESLTMQMRLNKWEFCKENPPPKALRQEWDDEWEDPTQWMEVEKHLDRCI